MRRLALIAAAAIVLSWTAYVLLDTRAAPAAPKRVQTTTPPPQAQAPEAPQADQSAHERQTQARIEALANREAAKKAQESFELQVQQARLRWQGARSAEWTRVVSTNWQTALVLHQTAANSPLKKAPCTICDGIGTMAFCVLCEHSGKCLDCKGTGKTPLNERCPTCRGSGKCYLCFGSGRMACPFCDDGTIYPNLPLPGTVLPIQIIAVSRPPTRPPGWERPPVESSTPTSEVAAQEPPAAERSEQHSPAPRSSRLTGWAAQSLMALGLLLCMTWLVRKLAPRTGDFLNEHFDPWQEGSTSAPTRARGKALNKAAAVVARSSPSAEDETPDTNPQPAASALAAADSSLAPAAPASPPAEGAADAFVACVPQHVSTLRTQLLRAGETSNENELLQVLGEFYVGVHTLSAKAELAQFQAAITLTSSLEGLVKKLLQKPDCFSASVLNTIAAALDLIEELCSSGAIWDFELGQLRILIVDDDPVARRTLSGSVQLLFGKPDDAENGEAALAATAETAYDLIFMDVQMPGMDGLTACAKIRQTTLNDETPMVFVTSEGDTGKSELSTLPGGNGFIPKPVVAAEIALAASAFALRGRFEKLRIRPSLALTLS